jgi:hypothetical protein
MALVPRPIRTGSWACVGACTELSVGHLTSVKKLANIFFGGHWRIGRKPIECFSDEPDIATSLAGLAEILQTIFSNFSNAPELCLG